MDTISESSEEVFDGAPDALAPVADLYRWSSNFDWPSPWALFLDLIGYSEENFGDTLYNLKSVSMKLGYVELDYLADALKCYAVRPFVVLDFIERLERTE